MTQEVIKVSKPLPNARHWIIRDINNSRVERVPSEGIANNVKDIMKDVKVCYFIGKYENHHWVISSQVVKGEEW